MRAVKNLKERVMKKIRKITAGLLMTILFAGSATSCKDFLNESLDTMRNTDYLETEDGIRDLAVGMYYTLRYHFAWEWAFAYTNYGTDEFRVGGDGSNEMWNSYNTNLASVVTEVNVNTAMADALWDNMYTAINTANTLIHKAPGILEAGTELNTILGEAYFIRGYNYYRLITQYGGVPLKLEPSEGVEREFERDSASDCAQQVIDDLEQAYALLPATAAATGKITRYAAAHFLAKAYLFRTSEINDSWNSATKTTDLSSGLQYADIVIQRHSLAPNFADIFYYTEPDGANEQLDEIILAAQFTRDASSWGQYGNQSHLYFLAQYLNLPYMQRDIAGGREYQRLRTTDFAYDVYDRVNDSRFWKSFKTKHAVNVPGDNYVVGDLSAIYIINEPGDARFPDEKTTSEFTDSRTGKTVPSVFVRYYTDGTPVLSTNAYQNRFASLSKYIDGSRNEVGDGIGYRDGILARVADTYLVAAEILIRQGDYNGALNYINTVRNRGAYKSGEDRSYYCDGGAASSETASSYIEENSYYESNNIAVTTAATDLTVTDIGNLPAEDEAIIATLGYTSTYDRMLCFLLNERSRELMGEYVRWEDLARTQTLVARAQNYNPEAASAIRDYHCLRPIPQSFLDAIQKDGKPLTSAEKSAMQNPGY